MHISFRSYLTITLDHHFHRSLHNELPFPLSTFSVYPSYPLWSSLPCTSYHFLIPFSSFDHIQLHSFPIGYATICSPFPLSIFRLSVSFLLVLLLYIYLGSYSSIVSLAQLLFLHSSEYSSHSYWLIVRLTPLDESDSIATSLCIYTYHE
jgi:hypothetical protein